MSMGLLGVSGLSENEVDDGWGVCEKMGSNGKGC